MGISLQLTVVLISASVISPTQSKFYQLSNQAYDYTVIKQTDTSSVFTCMILCDQELSCHTFLWIGINPPCVLVGRRGTTLLSSMVEFFPFYTSQDNATITLGSTGVANGSYSENAFSAEPDVFYQSAYAVNFTTTIDFKVMFRKLVTVTSIRLILINFGMGDQNITEMHWHVGSNPICVSSTPYPRPIGILLSFDCPSAAIPVNTAALHVIFRGHIAFNNLKIIGPDYFALYP